MIDRYTIKINPAVSHADFLKKLDEMKEYDPKELKRLQHLKLKIEVVCEAADLKPIKDVLQKLSELKSIPDQL